MDEYLSKRRNALAKYLTVSVNAIKTDDEDAMLSKERFNTPYGTYYVMDRRGSLENAKSIIEEDISNLGLKKYIEYFNSAFGDVIQGSIIKCVNNNTFDKICEEDYQDYATVIAHEQDDEYENRLVRECLEHNIIDMDDIEDGKYTGDDDLEEELATTLYDKVKENYDSFVEWYVDYYSFDQLSDFLKNDYYTNLDLDKLTEILTNKLGFGYFIATYDNETIELNGFYAYRID